MVNRDILWKGLMEPIFDDFLRFLYPDADKLFDLKRKMNFLDKELAELYPTPEQQIDVRHVDKLIEVSKKDGSNEWVLFHLEVQGKTKTADRPLFGQRMFRYFYRIYDKYQKPVAAIAVFTGSDGHFLPNRLDYVFMDTRLQYQFKTLNIRDFSDTQLRDSNNPFAWAVLIAKKGLMRGKKNDNRLLEIKLSLFKELHENQNFDKQKLRAIMIFLVNYLQFEKKEINSIFRERIEQFTDKKTSMDIFEQVAEWQKQDLREEAMKEGIQKADEKSVRILLLNTDFSIRKIASLLEVSIAFVKKVKAELSVK